MRVVEITGPPGSGKSTIAGAVREYLENHAINTCTASDLILQSGRYPFDQALWRGLITQLPGPLYRKCLRGMNNYLHLKNEFRLKFFLDHLPMFEELQTILTSIGSGDFDTQWAVRLLLKSGGLFQMATDAPDEDAVFLLDEGFTHRAVSLFVPRLGNSIEDSTIIENFVKIVPRCQAVICVNADLATSARRLKGRGLTRRLRGASEGEVNSYISRAGDVIDLAKTTLKQMGVPVFDIQNVDEPFAKSSITTQLGPFLKSLYQIHPRCDRRHKASVEMAATKRSPAFRNP